MNGESSYPLKQNQHVNCREGRDVNPADTLAGCWWVIVFHLPYLFLFQYKVFLLL